MQIDRIDRKILNLLQTDARLSNKQLADKVGLSESACLRRVKLLEDSGIVARYVMLVNQDKAGKPDNVYVHITLENQSQQTLKKFEDAVSRMPEVMECFLMTGDFDYLLRIVTNGTADYERVHNEKLTKLPGVARVKSSFSVRTVVKNTRIEF
ncbi:MAG: Lrp/AsnC family transcriptional regulator [Rhodospirillaceae bacterium]|nr:Lrp/AsnC family transcriptional regulator [Rhodospirillaceae bacterium]